MKRLATGLLGCGTLVDDGERAGTTGVGGGGGTAGGPGGGGLGAGAGAA
jgi:hypothetical protein